MSDELKGTIMRLETFLFLCLLIVILIRKYFNDSMSSVGIENRPKKPSQPRPVFRIENALIDIVQEWRKKIIVMYH